MPTKNKKIKDFDKSRTVTAVLTGEAAHYAFILDRSDAGLLLESHIMANGPEDLRETFFKDAFRQWRASSLPFLVLWGSFDSEHNMALGARDEDELLNEALLEIQNRTQENGNEGCAFFLGLTPSVSDNLRKRLSSSQLPPAGTSLH